MRVLAICVSLAMTGLTGCVSAPEQAATNAVPATAAPAAAPAAPQPAAGQTAATQPTAMAAADDNEIVCRNEKPLGTRIGKRVCKTRAQMREEEEAARQMMKNRDSKAYGVTAPITGT